jgi:hypothetical protein
MRIIFHLFLNEKTRGLRKNGFTICWTGFQSSLKFWPALNLNISSPVKNKSGSIPSGLIYIYYTLPIHTGIPDGAITPRP